MPSSARPPLPPVPVEADLLQRTQSAGPTPSAAESTSRASRFFKRKDKKSKTDGDTTGSGHKRRPTGLDVIDRLDLTGLGGSTLFHHDGPYDAVAPHRNRHQKKAPMLAFDPATGASGDPLPNAEPRRRAPGGVSARAQAAMAAMDDHARGLEKAHRPSASVDPSSMFNAAYEPALSYGGGGGVAAVEGPDDVNGGGPSRLGHVDEETDDGGDGDYSRSTDYYNHPSSMPNSRKVKTNPNAEVWGLVDEPWEDFAAPRAARGPTTSKGDSHLRPGSQGQGSGLNSETSSVVDMEAVFNSGTYRDPTSGEYMTGEERWKARQAERLKADVSLGDADKNGAAGGGGRGRSESDPFGEKNAVGFGDASPDGAGGYAMGMSRSSSSSKPKRTKSLMKRIRQFKENGHIPMGNIDLDAEHANVVASVPRDEYLPGEGPGWGNDGLVRNAYGGGGGGGGGGRPGEARRKVSFGADVAQGSSPTSTSQHTYSPGEGGVNSKAFVPSAAVGDGADGGYVAGTVDGGAGMERSGSMFRKMGRFGKK